MTALYAAVDLRQLGSLINRPTPKPTGEIDNLTLVSMLLDRGANPNARLRLPLLPRFHNAGDAQLARRRDAADACGQRAGHAGDAAAPRQGRGPEPRDEELHRRR